MDTTPDVAATTEVATVEELTLPERLQRYARIAALKAAVCDYEAAEKKNIETDLRDLHATTGSKSFEANDDEGNKAMTLGFSDDKPKVIVTDADALYDFVFEHFPSETETVYKVRDSFLAVLLKQVEHSTAGVFHPDLEGVEVPGLTHVPGVKAKTFSVRWSSKDAKSTLLAETFHSNIAELGMGEVSEA